MIEGFSNNKSIKPLVHIRYFLFVIMYFVLKLVNKLDIMFN